MDENYSIWKTYSTLINPHTPLLIKSPVPNFEWHITRESKKILGYTCYKATASYSFYDFLPKEGNKLEIIKKTKYYEAWFTPQIPFAHGPVGIGGLPGLILELKIGAVRYIATSARLDRRNVQIKVPEKGMKISREEYKLRLQLKIFEQMKNRVVNPEKAEEIRKELKKLRK